MNSARKCVHSGFLVPWADDSVSQDPAEFAHDFFFVDCNQLKCTRCKEWVVSQPNDEGRRYRCSCKSYQCARLVEIDNDHDSPDDPDVPWRCAGHPAPELPAAIGELKVASGTPAEWSAVVDQVLTGKCPRPLGKTKPGSDEEGPGDWLTWLGGYWDGTPMLDALSNAVAVRFGGDDPVVRGRVLYFFERLPGTSGAESILKAAVDSPRSVAIGYPIPEEWTPPTVWNVAVARLARSRNRDNAGDRLARQLLETTMTTPLDQLPHDDIGPTDLLAIRLRQNPLIDLSREGDRRNHERYAAMLKSLRVDVVRNTLEGRPVANAPVVDVWKDAELLQWIADNIVHIEEAGRNRWAPLMDAVASNFQKPELGHLIVIAGTRLIQSRLIPVAELRTWISTARGRGLWVDEAWVSALETELETAENRLPSN